MGFYEDIAADYDDMTRFHARVQQETAILKSWIARYGFRSAVDVACGTGIHAIVLAKQGIRTIGVDLSEAMLEHAKRHAAEFGAQVAWVCASMQDVRRHLDGEHDTVFCLGNSLPHLLTQTDLTIALKNFADVLRPSGLLVLQLLNYDRILAEHHRIVGIHRHGSTEFIRFYDFLADQLCFNLLTIRWENGNSSHTLNSTPLHPYRKDELERALNLGGFTALEYYGDMQFHPFEAQTSTNLVLVGKKSR